MTDLPLAADFPGASFEEWRELAEKTLNGASFKRKLVSRTYDGLKIEPLYARANAQHQLPSLHGPCNWAIMQPVDHADPASANAALHEELQGGASGVLMRISADGAHKGVTIGSVSDLDRALANVDVTETPVRLQARGAGASIAALAHAWHQAHDIPSNKSRMAIGFDPFAMLIDGVGDSANPAQLLGLTAPLLKAGYSEPVLAVDGHRIHCAGASEAQELACAAAMGVETLRALEAAGFTIEEAQAAMRFVFASDADIFLTLAKLRAWPLIWSRILNACGAAAGDLRFAAHAAARMLTARNASVNMLRATAAVFAGAVAGADEITVDAHTSALGTADSAARRLARNTQIILQEESNVGRIGDPAAGSWYADSLTVELAQKAWDTFRAIEAKGGMTAALEQGFVQAMIAETDAVRDADIAKRKLPLTGISEFATLSESETASHERSEAEPAAAQTISAADWQAAVNAAAAGAFPVFAGNARNTPQPLPQISLASAFEALRDVGDAAAKNKGGRPAIFVASLGEPSDFAARATWAKNFFAAGGIETLEAADVGDATALKQTFGASRATAVCICGSDALYEEKAAETAAVLKEAGAVHVYLAGRPNDAYKQAGVDSFIFAGCNVLESLEAAHALLSG